MYYHSSCIPPLCIDNQKMLNNYFSLFYLPVMEIQTHFLPKKKYCWILTDLSKNLFWPFFCPPYGLSEMAYHWIQKRCPGEKRAKVATDKSPKSTLGGITPNLRDETCRALNYVWKIGITKEQQGKQHGTEIGNTFLAGSPLIYRHTSDNEHV